MSQRIFHVDTRSLCSRVGSCFRGGREDVRASIELWCSCGRFLTTTEKWQNYSVVSSPQLVRQPPRLPFPLTPSPIRDRRLPWRQSCEVRRGCDPRVFLSRSISISSTDCTSTHCPVKVSPHTVARLLPLHSPCFTFNYEGNTCYFETNYFHAYLFAKCIWLFSW